MIEDGAPTAGAAVELEARPKTVVSGAEIGPTETIFGPVFVSRPTVEDRASLRPAEYSYLIERGDLDRFHPYFTLIVRNGDESGGVGVSSGSVSVDGVYVVERSDLSRAVGRIERTISVVEGSQLVVWIAGKPGGTLTIEVVGHHVVPEGFVYIAPGTFTMGSPETELGRGDDETRHVVTLTRGFYISKYEVTHGLWAAVHGRELTTDADVPFDGFKWAGAVRICNDLSVRDGLEPAYTWRDWEYLDGDVTWNRSANGYRLPTEAEWEYACRAGTESAFPSGDITFTGTVPVDPALDLIGWYGGNMEVPQRVGLKAPNAWGLYDMNGYVAEWVWDAYRSEYEGLSSTDPVDDGGVDRYRVQRGGRNWGRGGPPYLYEARYCRSAARHQGPPSHWFDGEEAGMRLVRNAP